MLKAFKRRIRGKEGKVHDLRDQVYVGEYSFISWIDLLFYVFVCFNYVYEPDACLVPEDIRKGPQVFWDWSSLQKVVRYHMGIGT